MKKKTHNFSCCRLLQMYMIVVAWLTSVYCTFSHLLKTFLSALLIITDQKKIIDICIKVRI